MTRRDTHNTGLAAATQDTMQTVIMEHLKVTLILNAQRVRNC